MVRDCVNALRFSSFIKIWFKSYSLLIYNRMRASKFIVDSKFFNYNLCFLLPARQFFFILHSLVDRYYFITSIGALLTKGAFKQKYFKKTIKALKPFTIFLKYFLELDSVAIFYLKFKHFNFKFLFFIDLFFSLIKPFIHLINITRAYNKRRGVRRRLKRKIFKLLLN